MSEMADLLYRRLRNVRDPELHVSVTDLQMIGDISVAEGHAIIPVALTTAACPLRHQIEAEVRAVAEATEGIASVEIVVSTMTDEAKRELLRVARAAGKSEAAPGALASIPLLAVMSGKGGVGKSTLTAALAQALARRGLRVGVLDADIWGFSLTDLLEITGEIEVRGGRMLPVTMSVGAGTVKLLSMGHLADSARALSWRGLMVQKAVAQFLDDADWSGCDLLLIDTPPGTGDIVMTLARRLPQLEALLVTSPDPRAATVAQRAADFAHGHGISLRGVIENQVAVNCHCGAVHEIFGRGGGELVAAAAGVDVIARLPWVTAGEDLLLDDLAESLWSQTHLPAVGCATKLLTALDAAAPN